MNQDLYNRLVEVLAEERVLKNEAMKMHTTFRIGGSADYFTVPVTKEEVKAVVEICKDL